MNKAVKKLLAVAVALVATIDEKDELQAGIDALNALGENATHSNGEYKSLKALVAETETAQANAGAGGNAGSGDENNTSSAGNGGDGEEPKKPKAEKKLSMAGIRMVGAKWYHNSDGYKKGFNTANECAEHFNK